jgi:putative heme-binding domain-containing protein
MRSTPSFCLALLACGLAVAADEPLPKVAEGWTIERVVQAPQIAFPTAVVTAPDGTIYLGQDPMDMPGPPSKPIDSVVAIKDGKVRTFAEGLWAVMGLEWVDGTLYVVHAPFLSAFTDTDGDGKADKRVDLMTGLGPANPAFNGINDHVPSGVRLGMDGFLYISIGDKGIPKGVGREGKSIRMKGGGVIRIRPDGNDLEIVSTGERNPLSVALTDRDDIFTYGNDDDSRRWPNSLTHHIAGGHYGYPYEFLTAPWRALPVTSGQVGGSGAQGICFNEDGLPARYRGNLFFCDWGLQTVYRFEMARSGATFKVERREAFVTKGDLVDFRPFSMAVDADRSSLLLVDWAFNGWLADVPRTGRLYRLRYNGKDAVKPAAVLADPLVGLDHPARAVRLEAERRLAGATAVAGLDARLKAQGNNLARAHALWALDAIGTPEARSSIRGGLSDPTPDVRLQALRSTGIRRDKPSTRQVVGLLRDPDPSVRREAAIALGRLGESGAAPFLYEALGDRDPFVAWSVRTAIRRLGAWYAQYLSAALLDPKRRDDALALADESWSLPSIQALYMAFKSEKDPAVRARIVANLAGQYRKYPEWSGNWFGTNPLAGEFPAKTVDWDSKVTPLVLGAVGVALKDADLGVRRQAILGLAAMGPAAAAPMLAALGNEADETNRAAMVVALGRTGEASAVPALGKLLAASDQPLTVRLAAHDALTTIPGRQPAALRFGVIYDRGAPPELIARALLPLGRAGALPPNDLADFLEGKPGPIRAAALQALSTNRRLTPDVQSRVIARLDDEDADVRRAAIDAVARLRLAAAVPKLIARAKTRDDAAEATHALEMLPDPRALEIYLDALGDRSPEVRRGAESALLAIRDRVSGEVAKRARDGQFSGPSALAVERILTSFRPVVAWKVIGPFPRTTAQVFVGERSIDLGRSHAGAEGRSIAWTPRAGDPKTGRVALDDLKGGLGDRGGFGYDSNGSPDLAAFAYAEIESDRDRQALLLFGSSGSLLATLNEAFILNVGGSGRPYAIDSDKVRVPLVKGTNRLLVRARQGIGFWGFSVQVSDPSDVVVVEKTPTRSLDQLRTFALNNSGDPRKGEEIFFDDRGVGCVKCHAAGGRGSANIGPDLTGLALKYDKAEIVRSVLEPSNRIATGYQPVLVARKDGKVVTGLVRADTDAYLDLADAEAKVTRIAKSEIEDRRLGDVSIMPGGLTETLTQVDLVDLVAYLLTLKAAPGAH